MTNKIIIGLVILVIIAGVGFVIKTPKQETTKSADSTPTLNTETKTTQPIQEAMAPKTKKYPSPPKLTLDKSKTYSATLTTSKGKLEVTLFADEVPNTVNNFVFLANEGFYDGTIFHRIVKTFMIQGGDPQGDGTGGPGYKFADEPITRDYTKGIVAMANSGPNTNGSQFFIMTQDTPLPKNYVIFGQLSGNQSLTTLDKIAATPTTTSPGGEKSQPLEKVTIQSVEITEN